MSDVIESVGHVCGVTPQPVDRGVDGIPVTVKVIRETVELTIQDGDLPGERIEFAGGEVPVREGNQLADNATHIPAAVDLREIAAFADESTALPGDTANIVTGAVVTDGAGVAAMIDDAGVVSGDAADVGEIEKVIFRNLGNVKVGVQKAVYVLFFGDDCNRVDGTLVHAAENSSVVQTDDPRHLMLSGGISGERAAMDIAGDHVMPDDAAHILHAGDGTLKAAVRDRAAVHTGNAAYKASGAARCDRPEDLQIADDGAFGDDTEKPLTGPVPCVTKTCDTMVLPVKAPTKPGNR